MENISSFRAFQLSSAILSIGLIIDTVNFFFKKELYYNDKGLFSYEKLTLDKRKYLKNIFVSSPLLFRFKPFFYIMLIRLVCSIFLLLFLSNHWFVFLVLFIVQLLFNIRNVYCLSGADQMQTIFLFGLMIYSFEFGTEISILSFYFIALQLLISYFFTGFHKLKSLKWRNGDALLLVLNSETFGNHTMLDFLYKNRKINIFFCWTIILFQLTFVFTFLLFPQLSIYYMFILFFFHLSIAFLMNLNHFFWVFLSCYPIVYYISINGWNIL